MSNNIVQFNEEIIKGQIKKLVRGSVEETLNELLEAEAEKLTQTARYERSEARQGYRSGHYDRNLTTTSGDVTLHVYDLDSWCGKMFPEPSPAAHQKEKTSGVSSRRSPELRSVVFQSLDLTHGHGNLLGESYWELISPWRGDASTLNTGVSPREENESSLSRILQDNPLKRYYLTKKACLGILRRAAERGKELPEKLKWALEIQAGLVLPDGRPTKLEAYHINQRDEGIDLHGVSGALMATSNMQMQTFVTQPDGKENEGCDGAIQPIAFAENQRDEVRDLHDVAGALGAQPGMKQQTFIAAGFSAGQGSKAGGVGYQEKCAPTLKASDSGTNMVPSILCLNDQGGSVMGCSEDVSGTLRAQEHAPLKQIEILIEENEKRLQNDYYRYELQKLHIVFCTPIHNMQNCEVVQAYRNALQNAIDDLFENIQDMRLEEIHSQYLLDIDCPPEYHYSFSKLSEAMYGGVPFIVTLGGIIDYLADVVDLLDCISLQEKYVVTIAGFYMRKKIEMSKLANESSERN